LAGAAFLEAAEPVGQAQGGIDGNEARMVAFYGRYDLAIAGEKVEPGEVQFLIKRHTGGGLVVR
jgi:hypothetical protein